ncbi:MAG: M24 family metallopeptidase [Nitrososphaerales archaeon]
MKQYKLYLCVGKNMTIYGKRRKKILSLAKGKQVVAMTGANVFYLTGFWGGGAALVLPDKTVVITTPLEEDRASELGQEAEVVVAKGWKLAVAALVKRLGKGPVVVDDDSEFKGAKRFTKRADLFLEARRVKDEVEVARIEKASKGLDRIFEALTKELRPGRTEWEVAAEVMRVATVNELTPSGSDSALSPTIVASGPNGALPHSELTTRRIREGDFVVADIFFRYQGYNSDETRTFAVGSATAEMRKNYATVLEAQERALDLIREGTVCEDVHMAAVKVLRKAGVEKYLNHSVGHGVGIDIHEMPAISKGSKSRLLANDVVTDEPGIYFPGRYGIRIEDTVKTGRKPVLLTRFTKELLTVG